MNPTILALLRSGIIDIETAERLDRQLDPVQARAWAEQLLTQRYAAGLSAQQSRLVEFIQANGYQLSDTQIAAFYEAENRLLAQSVADGISEVVNERAAIAAVTASLSDSFNFVNRQLLAWVDFYTSDVDEPGTVGQLNRTSRQRVGEAFTRWYNGELGGRADGLPQLIRALEPTFGAARAEAIGVTEVTRIFVGMQRAAEAENPNVTSWRWQTANDELVCPICRPLNGLVILKTAEGWQHPDSRFGLIRFPPAHVRCRCGITPETELTVNVGSIFEAIGNGRR